MLLWRLTMTGRRRGHFSDHAKPLQLCEKRCKYTPVYQLIEVGKFFFESRFFVLYHLGKPL